MRSFDLTKAAQADLKSIARYTQQRWGVRQRNAYLKEMDHTFRSLARDPEIGRACDEIREGYGKFPHGTHVIYYRQVAARRMQVVRILHAAMDLGTHLGDDPVA